MKPVEFPQVNTRIAENQPEYITLPAHIADDAEKTTITCFELTDQEIEKIVKTRRIWHRQLVFLNEKKEYRMQPIMLMVDNPFGEVVEGTHNG